jgi:hypothetical protein
MIIITFIREKYRLLVSIGFYLLITANCFADPTNPGNGYCDGVDGGPDECPLDTWVIILVIAAVIFTAIHLQRKQKSLQA